MQGILDLPGTMAQSLQELAKVMAFGGDPLPPPVLAPSPRDTVYRDGIAQLYRFRRPEGAPPSTRRPLLVVPSMINRWYVLDLRKGNSFCEALAAAGVDTYLLDWGIPRDEDRYFTWDEVIDRLARFVRAVQRETGADQVAIMGYCMGATLSTIYTALHPEKVCALVNLAGPIDFSEGGVLRHMVDRRWFDPSAIAAAGNVTPTQMQDGFTAMRPTLNLSKVVGYVDRMHLPAARDGFYAMETWGNDNIPFPAAAYETYITELYQKNALVQGQHRVRGRVADLKSITCPILVIGAERDTICPLPAAKALIAHAGATDTAVLQVPGGHVGAVVGSKAAKELYPQTAAWLRARLDA
jgi:polyhydroxyalkanoate synthase